MIKIDTMNYRKIDIAIIGTGGTGSHLISFLTQLIGNDKRLRDAVRLILVDEDVVEEKNLRTQKFLKTDVNYCKSEVLADRYSSIYGMNISYIDKYVNDTEDVRKVFDGSCYAATNKILISCVDNNKARRVLDEYFNEFSGYESFVYIDTGNSSGQGERHGQSIVGYRRGDNVILPSISSYCSLEDEVEDKMLSCGEQILRSIQNIGANITSATTVFNILNSILCECIIPGDIFIFNASRLEGSNLRVNN